MLANNSLLGTPIPNMYNPNNIHLYEKTKHATLPSYSYMSKVYVIGSDEVSMLKSERALINEGHIVRNPSRLISKGLESHEWLREAMKLLLECDSIYLCPHFSKNKFIELQYQVANTLGLKLLEHDVIIETKINNNKL